MDRVTISAKKSFHKTFFKTNIPAFQAAGGIAAGDSIRYTLIKECQEEASIPESLARHAVSAGAVRSVVFTTCKELTFINVVTWAPRFEPLF